MNMQKSDFSFPKKAISQIGKIFIEKGYPKESLSFFFPVNITNKDLQFSFFLPLVVKISDMVYLIVDYKPASLLSYERGILSLARSYFKIPPPLAIITNGKDAIKIWVYSGKSTKNFFNEVIPKFEELRELKFQTISEEKRKKEKKLLLMYLSGG